MLTYPYMMQQGGQNNWSPKEWGQFFKQLNGKEKDGKKKKDDEEFEIIRRPKRKPRTLSVCQAFFLFTATFPVVAPLYYFTVVGSWELLKFGLANMLK